MTSLLKRDFLVTSGMSDFSIMFALILAYVSTLPPSFTFFVITLSLLITVYFYDHRSNMNRFTISLPISEKTIIYSRYVYFLIVSIVIISLQLLIGYGLDYVSSTAYYVYSWKDVVTLFCLALIIGGIFIPLFYLVNHFFTAATLIMLIYFFLIFFSLEPLTSVLGMENYVNFNALDPGFALLIEEYIPVFPFVFLPIMVTLIYFLSMNLSIFIWRHKDH